MYTVAGYGAMMAMGRTISGAALTDAPEAWTLTTTKVYAPMAAVAGALAALWPYRHVRLTGMDGS